MTPQQRITERLQFAHREFAFGEPAQGRDGEEVPPKPEQRGRVVGMLYGRPLVRYWPDREAA